MKEILESGGAPSGGGTAQPDAIARATAVYTPFSLTFYDTIVHGLSNRFAWACPTSKILDLYRRNLSANHLEAAVGTGLFLDRAAQSFDRLALLDINRHCLECAARRLRRFRPECRVANLLAPLALDLPPFDSVGLTYVLHCLPGTMADKLAVIDHLKPRMADGAVLFGASILGKAVEPNGPARALFRLYNNKGVFNNLEDDLQSLRSGLERRFSQIDLTQIGLVALFSAR